MGRTVKVNDPTPTGKFSGNGDEIDTMRSFAPETQRSTGKLDSYQLIGRSGITAGGAADSDAIAYFEKSDFTFINVFPDNSRSKLRRYATEKELQRFDDFSAFCRKEDRERTFFDLAPDETPEESKKIISFSFV